MPGKHYYSDDDPEVGVTPSQLKRLSRARKREYALSWFAANFEDPANETPYNGQEGGYLYIYGGPYDAREQLGDEFVDTLPEELIEEIASEVESDGIVDWAPGPQHPDHERAAADHAAENDEELVPDVDELLARIESGERTTIGDPFEVERRGRLADAAAKMLAALDGLRPPLGQMGHNGPPLDDDGNPIPAEFEDEAREAVQAIVVEAAKDVPDPLTVARAASRLERFKDWLKPKLDKGADEFFKELGGAAAKGIVAVGVIACTALVPPLHHLVAAAEHWLIATLAAF